MALLREGRSAVTNLDNGAAGHGLRGPARSVRLAVGGRARRAHYVYDAAGRGIEFHDEGPGGAVLHRRHYDASGRLLRMTAGPPGDLRIILARSYRADGSFTELIPAPAAGPPRGVLKRLPGSLQLYRMPQLAAVRTEFSPAGLPHWSAFEAPERGYIVFLRYAPNNLLAEEFATAPGTVAIPQPDADYRWPGEARLARLSAAAEQRTTYQRDAAGRVEREACEKAGFSRVVRRQWDRSGNLIAESTRRPDGTETVLLLSYKFDSLGNWVHRTIRSSSPGAASTLVGEEERTITYY